MDIKVVKKILKVVKLLNMKVNNLEKKIIESSALLQASQYNTDKQNLEKRIVDVDKKIFDVSGLVTLPG